MSDKLEKLKFLYATLDMQERKEFVEFGIRFEKDTFDQNTHEKKTLETKAFSSGPVSVVNSSGRCVLCGK